MTDARRSLACGRAHAMAAAAHRSCCCQPLGGVRRLQSLVAWLALGLGLPHAGAQQYGVIGEAQYSLSMNGVNNAVQLPLLQGITAVSAWLKLDSAQLLADRVLLDARPGGGDDAVFSSEQVRRQSCAAACLWRRREVVSGGEGWLVQAWGRPLVSVQMAMFTTHHLVSRPPTLVRRPRNLDCTTAAQGGSASRWCLGA